MLRAIFIGFSLVLFSACDSSSSSRDIGVTVTDPTPPLASAPQPTTMVSMELDAAQGGSLMSSDGALMMSVAPMAVTADTTITIEALPAESGQPALEQATDGAETNFEPLMVYEFGPAGTEFTEPVLVEIVVPREAPNLQAGEIPLGVAALLSSDGVLEEELQQSLIVNENNELVLQVFVPHFSDLIVIGEPQVSTGRFTFIAPDEIREGAPVPVRLEGRFPAEYGVGWERLNSSSPNLITDGLLGLSSTQQRPVAGLTENGSQPRYTAETTIACANGDGETHGFDFFTLYLSAGGLNAIFFTSFVNEFTHTFTCLPPFDETPDPFEFSDQFNVPLSTEITSDPVTITGLDRGLVTVPAGHTYSIGCTGDFIDEPTFINEGQSLCIKHTSAAEFDRQIESTVSVGTATATFSSFTRRNDAPVAQDDEYTVTNTILTVPAPGILANDSEPDSDPVTITDIVAPDEISLTVADDGRFEVVLPPGNNTSVFTFQYTLEDSNGTKSNPATVTLFRAVDETPPTGSPDEFSTAKNTVLDIPYSSILGNDDPDSFLFIFNVVSGSGSGTEIVANGELTLRFQPGTDFVGTVVLEYVLEDLAGNKSLPIEIRIEVFDTNATPIAANDEYTVQQDTTLNVPPSGVLNNDDDANDTDLTSTLVQTTQNGVLSLGLSGAFDYTPNAGFVGTDSFTYDVTDPDGASDRGVVIIMVTEKPEDPCTNEDTFLAVVFDLGASNESGESIPPGTEVPLRDIARGIVVESIPEGCPVVKLNGNIYATGFGGPFPTPSRDENDPLESCAHGEVVTKTVCLDPLQTGEVAEGLQTLTNPELGGGAEDEPINKGSIISQVESVLVVASPRALVSDVNTPSVSAIGSKTVHGPLVFTGIQPTSRGDAGAFLDLSTGELVDAVSFSFTEGFQFSVREPNVTDEDARTWIVGGSRVTEHVSSRDPDLVRYNNALGLGVDSVPVGYTGNFLGRGTGFVAAHNSVLLVSTFINPPPTITGSFFEDANNHVVRTSDFSGMTGNIISGAVQSTDPEPPVLALESGTPGSLWFHSAAGGGLKIATLGNDPNVVRCIDQAICVVVNVTDATLTSFTWDGATAPVEIETVSVATNPGIPDLVKTDSGYRAAVVGDGNNLNVLDLPANGSVTTNQSETLDASCVSPQNPLWFLDSATGQEKLFIPCPGNGFSDGTNISEYLVVIPD